MEVLEQLKTEITSKAIDLTLKALQTKYSNIKFSYGFGKLRTNINECCEDACWGFRDDFDKTLESNISYLIAEILKKKGE